MRAHHHERNQAVNSALTTIRAIRVTPAAPAQGASPNVLHKRERPCGVPPWPACGLLLVALASANCGRLHFDAATSSADAASDSGTAPFARCGNGVLDDNETCDDGKSGLSNDGCSSQCSIETWAALDVPQLNQPPGRDFAKLIYDEANARTLMFGGRLADGSFSQETWSYSQGQWRKLNPPNAPSPRIAAAMAYDRSRQRVVLYGGETSAGSTLNDTWEFDGETWQQVNTANSPGGRSRAMMAYDQARQRVVLFGGRQVILISTTVTNDTWEFDGTTWQRIQPPQSPSAREAGAFVYDNANQRIVLFGGNDPDIATIDTAVWTYNGTWQRHPASSTITGRVNHAMTYDAHRKQVLLFGGFDTARRRDTWILNGNTLQWELLSIGTTNEPPPMARHDMVYDAARDANILFSGFNGARPLDTTWEFRDQWLQRIESNIDIESICEAPTQHRVWGYAPLHRALVAFDTAGAILASKRPTFTAKLLCSYGYAVDELLALDENGGTTFRWTGQAWNAGPPTTSRVTGTRIAFDEAHRNWVRFGGQNILGGQYTNETYIMATNWQRVTTLVAPAARSNYAMAYDRKRQRTVLFGGTNLTQRFNDTWEFDGMRWTQIPTGVAPSARRDAAMTYDPHLQTILLLGGASSSTESSTDELRDMWSYDETGWHLLGEVPPFAGRLRHVAALLPSQGLLVPNDQGTLRPRIVRYQAAAPQEQCLHATDADGDGFRGCADPDCWAYCRPACGPDAACTQAPQCSDGQCQQLTESAQTCAADCSN